MLTEAEKKGCLRLLDKLTNEEILSLKNTITNRLIAAENRHEATKVIIEYSQSAVELLRRKKVRRDVLFQYLADCGVVVPANAEKHELIHRVLQHWGSSVSSTSELTETNSDTRDTVPSSPPDQTQPNPRLKQRLGETFARWFYNLLNSENPSCRAPAEDLFGPHHFWENSTLKLVSRTPDLNEDSYEGHVLVAQRLQALAKEEQLVFHPNICADGVRVQSSPHGPVIVMVCGTLHQHDHCLGVFEQVFGLISSPLNDNTWKVKFTQLHLTSSQVTAHPKLTDASARELLSITNSTGDVLRV